MDWLIDTADPATASARALSLLEAHLARHAVDPGAATRAVRGVGDRLRAAVADAAGRPVHVSMEWTAAPAVVTVAAVDDVDAPRRDGVGTDAPVPARQRSVVRGWPQHDLGTIEVAVVRRTQHTFDAGPPPVLGAGIDPASQGTAAVALALAAAIDAHPTASTAQAAAIAGALIASAGVEGEHRVADVPTDPRTAAEAFVALHRALGADAYVVSTDDRRVELAVTRCPFGGADGPAAALCHVSSGLAGQLAARVGGTSTVVLDEAIVHGDPECHLQVLLGPADPEQPEAGAAPDVDGVGESFFWPPRGTPPAGRVPHLDLSVALPRESVSVPVVRRLAAQALRAFGVHDEDVDDVQLAITEACANVIDHAGATETYDVKIELSADRCAITVIDQGGGFDATQVPDEVDHDAEMGRGLALMRALVDNVAFRNEPQAGAVVHMVKTLDYDADHPLRRD